MTEASRDRAHVVLRMNAALDGELDAANALELEREIAADPALQAVRARLASTRAALRAAAPKERAPAGLRARVMALAEPADVRPSRPPRLAHWPRALAASLATVALASLFAWSLQWGRSIDDPAVAALVAGYMRAEISGQPIDVASSDRHTVKPWLASRVTLGADVVDLGNVGYPLVGGRIDIVGRAPAPTLVYRRNEHLISVSELPAPRGRDGSTWRGAVDGYRVERWSDAERAYVAISDIDAVELTAFVGLFQRAQRGERETPPAPKP